MTEAQSPEGVGPPNTKAPHHDEQQLKRFRVSSLVIGVQAFTIPHAQPTKACHVALAVRHGKHSEAWSLERSWFGWVSKVGLEHRHVSACTSNPELLERTPDEEINRVTLNTLSGSGLGVVWRRTHRAWMGFLFMKNQSELGENTITESLESRWEPGDE